MNDAQLLALQERIRTLYSQTTQYLTLQHVTLFVPDFREYKGATVEKRSWELTKEDQSRTMDQLAALLVQRVHDWERELIDRALPTAHLPLCLHRCFLEGHERPTLLQNMEQVKLRHIFSVAVL